MDERCRSCGAPVRWVPTEAGRSMPLDAEPSDRGNVELRAGVAVVVDPDQPTLTGEPRYVAHFSTCPDADRWRRRG